MITEKTTRQFLEERVGSCGLETTAKYPRSTISVPLGQEAIAFDLLCDLERGDYHFNFHINTSYDFTIFEELDSYLSSLKHHLESKAKL